MALIKEYMNENCRIKVYDDSIIRNPEEVQEIVNSVSRLVISEEIRRNAENKERKGYA